MNQTVEGSSDSSHRSSSNEYVTADELGVDANVTDSKPEEPATPVKSRRSLRVLDLMDAIRIGLSSPFSRSDNPKSVTGSEPSKQSEEKEETETNNPVIQSFSAQFYRKDSVVPSGYKHDHGGRNTAVRGTEIRYGTSLTKYEKDQIRPVFGFDTRHFGTSSSSDHAITSKNWRQNLRSRRTKRMTRAIEPCESYSSEGSYEDTEITDNGVTEETLLRKASGVLVSDVMRKAISYLTVQNMIQGADDPNYADLEKGDVRVSKDFVFWEEREDDTTPSGDAEDGKVKHVPTPYPKKRHNKNDGSFDPDAGKTYQLLQEIEEVTNEPRRVTDQLDLGSPVIRNLSEEFGGFNTSLTRPEDEFDDTRQSDDVQDNRSEEVLTQSIDVMEHSELTSTTYFQPSSGTTADSPENNEDICTAEKHPSWNVAENNQDSKKHSGDFVDTPPAEIGASSESENEFEEFLCMPIQKCNESEEVPNYVTSVSDYIQDVPSEVLNGRDIPAADVIHNVVDGPDAAEEFDPASADPTPVNDDSENDGITIASTGLFVNSLQDGALVDSNDTTCGQEQSTRIREYVEDLTLEILDRLSISATNILGDSDDGQESMEQLDYLSAIFPRKTVDLLNSNAMTNEPTDVRDQFEYVIQGVLDGRAAACRQEQAIRVREYMEDISSDMSEGINAANGGYMELGYQPESNGQSGNVADASHLVDRDTEYDGMADELTDVLDKCELFESDGDIVRGSYDDEQEQLVRSSDDTSSSAQNHLPEEFEDAFAQLADDIYALAVQHLSSYEGTSTLTQPSDEFEDTASTPTRLSDEEDSTVHTGVRGELEYLSATHPGVDDGENLSGFQDDGNEMDSYDAHRPTSDVMEPTTCDDHDDKDDKDAFVDALDNDGSIENDVTNVTPMDESLFLSSNVEDNHDYIKTNEGMTLESEQALHVTNKLVSISTHVDAYQMTGTVRNPYLEDAAEQIVYDSIEVVKNAALQQELPRDCKPYREPQCWEDLLERDDDEAMSLSDFEISDISFLKDELAGMRETIDEVVGELKNLDVGTSERNEPSSPGEGKNDRSSYEPIVEIPETASDENLVSYLVDEGNVIELCEHKIEDISPASSEATLRSRISFWEELAGKGPIVSEESDRIVPCGYCKDSHSIRSGSPVPCSVTGQEYEISEYESDEKPTIELYDEGSNKSFEEVTDVTQDTTTTANEGACFALGYDSTGEQEDGDGDTEQGTGSEVKARISIWEELPIQKGQHSGKPSLHLDTSTPSTREKVAFFEQMATPQSNFHKRSSSPLSFKKDYWLRRFRKQKDSSLNDDLSPLVRQPNSAYDSGIWTNEAFFESPSLDISCKEDAIPEDDKVADFGASKQSIGSGKTGGHELAEKRYEDDSRIVQSSLGDEAGETPDESKQSAGGEFEKPDQGDGEVENEFQYDTVERTEDLVEGKHTTEEHDFFLEVIGEEVLPVGPHTEPRVAKDTEVPALEVVGSKMKLHPAPEAGIPALKEALPLVKKKKKNLLSIFRRKSKKLLTASSGKVRKEKKVAGDFDDLNHYVDYKIKKKSKKSKSNDWGFINIDPEIASLVRSSDSRESSKRATIMYENEQPAVPAEQFSYQQKDPGKVITPEDGRSRTIEREGVSEDKSEKISVSDSLDSGQELSSLGNGKERFMDAMEPEGYDSESDNNYETAEQSLALLDVEQMGEELPFPEKEPESKPDKDNHDHSVIEEPMLEVIGSRVKQHVALNAETPTVEEAPTSKKKKSKLTLFHKKSKKQDITPKRSEESAPVSDGSVIDRDLPEYVDRKITKKAKKSRSNDWGYIDIKPEVPNGKTPSTKKRWKMFRRT